MLPLITKRILITLGFLPFLSCQETHSPRIMCKALINCAYIPGTIYIPGVSSTFCSHILKMTYFYYKLSPNIFESVKLSHLKLPIVNHFESIKGAIPDGSTCKSEVNTRCMCVGKSSKGHMAKI